MNCKKRIIAAFLNVTEHNSIFQVLNDEIITEAKVSRGTFYNQFNNKTAIINTIENQIYGNIIREINHHFNNETINQTTFYNALIMVTKCSLPIIYKYRRLLKQLDRCKLNYIWETPLSINSGKLIDEICTDKSKVNPQKRQILIEITLILIETWINESKIQSLDRIPIEFTNLLNTSIEQLLKIVGRHSN